MKKRTRIILVCIIVVVSGSILFSYSWDRVYRNTELRSDTPMEYWQLFSKAACDKMVGGVTYATKGRKEVADFLYKEAQTYSHRIVVYDLGHALNPDSVAVSFSDVTPGDVNYVDVPETFYLKYRSTPLINLFRIRMQFNDRAVTVLNRNDSMLYLNFDLNKAGIYCNNDSIPDMLLTLHEDKKPVKIDFMLLNARGTTYVLIMYAHNSATPVVPGTLYGLLRR